MKLKHCFFRNSLLKQHRNATSIIILILNKNMHKHCVLLIGVVLEITIKFHTSLSKLMHCCLPLEFRQNLYKFDSCIRRAIHSLRLLLTEAELMNGSIRQKRHEVLLKKRFASKRARGVWSVLVHTPWNECSQMITSWRPNDWLVVCLTGFRLQTTNAAADTVSAWVHRCGSAISCLCIH